MSIIKILPENLVNQIAAGEVVERPASVVKELIENAIDAQADYIILEITGAGDELIRITDNGSGMSREDAKLALERHATSKISSSDDLFTISTMGFRGEALASIASVSHFTLKTKQAGDDTGTVIESEGGTITKYEECATQDGTQIEVKHLFYNTPARKKYLKTPSTEYQNILQIFQGMALSYPSIHFTIVHDEKTKIEYPKAESLVDRLRAVLGSRTADNSLPISFDKGNIKIDGFIGKPELARSGTKHQYLFVNNRQISHPLFSYALADSYGSLLMHGKKPFFVLNITIDPTLIDVNVHPRKLEIRFLNQSELFGILQMAVKKVLEKNVLMPTMMDYHPSSPTNDQVKASFEFNKELVGNEMRPIMPGRLNKYTYHQEVEEELSMMPIAQVAKSYIVAESGEGIVLIDQHAAHERVKFEELMNEFEKKEPGKQPLLIPQDIEFSASEAAIFEEYKETFAKMGFEIEHFGGNTYVIQAVPTPVAQDNIDSIVMNVIHDLADTQKSSAVNDPSVRVLEYMSCRSAIKFGDNLSMDEMISLVRQMDKLKRPYTCPHGRPTMVKLTYDELENRFKRKNF